MFYLAKLITTQHGFEAPLESLRYWHFNGFNGTMVVIHPAIVFSWQPDWYIFTDQ